MQKWEENKCMDISRSKLARLHQREIKSLMIAVKKNKKQRHKDQLFKSKIDNTQQISEFSLC